MKKALVIAMAAALCLGMTACTRSSAGPDGGSLAETHLAAGSSEETFSGSGVSPEDETYAGSDEVPDTEVDNGNVRIKIVDVEPCEGGIAITLECENKTDERLMFGCVDAAFDGSLVSPQWECSVAPGRTTEQTFTIPDNASVRNGRPSWVSPDMDFYFDTLRLYMTVSEPGQEGADAPFIFDGMVDFHPHGPVSGIPGRVDNDTGVVIYENEQVRIRFVSLDETETGKAEGICYCIENKTGRELFYELDVNKVNDREAGASDMCYLRAHTFRFITFKCFMNVEVDRDTPLETMEMTIKLGSSEDFLSSASGRISEETFTFTNRAG